VIKNRFPLFLAAVAVCSPVLAQNADKPLAEGDLLKQIEAIKPASNAPSVLPLTPTSPIVTPPLPGGAQVNQSSSGAILKLPGDKITADGTEAPTKGATDQKPPNVTEITAIEATFDQKSNIAVFVTSVVVKDPQFNVECDKLTAYLKKGDDIGTLSPRTEGFAPKPVNSPLAAVTPVPTPVKASPTPTRKPGTAQAAASPAPTAPGASPAPIKKKGSGLDKAVAVTTSERRVRITQDKVEADGSITHGIGLSDRAEYYSSNGDIYLYGMPDVTQGMNRCIATAPETWMKLNRDGRMEAHGPHRTFIVDTSGDRDKPANGATPSPTATPR